jgi:hypothetical protein
MPMLNQWIETSIHSALVEHLVLPASVNINLDHVWIVRSPPHTPPTRAPSNASPTRMRIPSNLCRIRLPGAQHEDG